MNYAKWIDPVFSCFFLLFFFVIRSNRIKNSFYEFMTREWFRIQSTKLQLGEIEMVFIWRKEVHERREEERSTEIHFNQNWK